MLYNGKSGGSQCDYVRYIALLVLSLNAAQKAVSAIILKFGNVRHDLQPQQRRHVIPFTVKF